MNTIQEGDEVTDGRSSFAVSDAPIFGQQRTQSNAFTKRISGDKNNEDKKDDELYQTYRSQSKYDADGVSETPNVIISPPDLSISMEFTNLTASPGILSAKDPRSSKSLIIQEGPASKSQRLTLQT